MKGRPKDKINSDGPGPGAYNGDINRIRDKAPDVKFGSPSKGYAKVSDTPGPGNYESPGYINPGGKGGGFSFGKE